MSAWRCRTQAAFELREGRFDGIQIRTVWRQEFEPSPTLFNEFFCLGIVVGGELIADKNVAWLQLWREHLPHVLDKKLPVHRAVKNARCTHPIISKSHDGGITFPVPVGRMSHAALPAQAACAQTGEFRVEARFIKEEEPLGEQRRLLPYPCLASQAHVLAFLFGGENRFFYK